MNKMSIRKDDLVVVLSGKDKGKQGKVLEVMPKSGKVVVEKVNVVSRHTKPRKQGDQAASSRRRPPSTPARCRRSAPSVVSPPASATRSRVTRRSASARSAAPKSKRGGVNQWPIRLT